MTSQQYSLEIDKFKGWIAGVRVVWSDDARVNLLHDSRVKGLDVGIGKAVTEHFLVEVTLQTQTKDLLIRGSPHEFSMSDARSQSRRFNDRIHVTGYLGLKRDGSLTAHVYLGNLGSGAQKYKYARAIGVSVVEKDEEGSIQISDLSWGENSWQGRTTPKTSGSASTSAIASTSYTPTTSTYHAQTTAASSYSTQATTSPWGSAQGETMSSYSTIPTFSDFPPLVTATSTSGYEYTSTTSAGYSETAITTVDSSYNTPATSASYASAALTTTSHEDLGMVWDTEHRRNKYWDNVNGMWRWAK